MFFVSFLFVFFRYVERGGSFDASVERKEDMGKRALGGYVCFYYGSFGSEKNWVESDKKFQN